MTEKSIFNLKTKLQIFKHESYRRIFLLNNCLDPTVLKEKDATNIKDRHYLEDMTTAQRSSVECYRRYSAKRGKHTTTSETPESRIQQMLE